MKIEDEQTTAEYTQIDKTKKTKKPKNCDAAAIPLVDNPQRHTVVKSVENENYVGFDRDSNMVEEENVNSKDTTDDGGRSADLGKTGHKKPMTSLKPAPPPPSSKPTVTSLKNPSQTENRPQPQQKPEPPKSTSKPVLSSQPGPASNVQRQPRKQAPSKPDTAPPNPPPGDRKSQIPPQKPPRLSADSSNSPTSASPPAENTYAKTYGHFQKEGRLRQPHK